jgi:hypothetical protein
MFLGHFPSVRARPGSLNMVSKTTQIFLPTVFSNFELQLYRLKDFEFQPFLLNISPINLKKVK